MGQHLRAPTPPPEPVRFVGRFKELQDIALWLKQQRVGRPSNSHGLPGLLVLHGPAGVGKSALAAMACQRHDMVTHWLSLADATRVDVEPTLLRLLAESGASRADIVRAAVAGGRRWRRTLRYELPRRLHDRMLVLDGAKPSVVRALMTRLRGCHGLVVLVTSREPTGWFRMGARMLDVTPMDDGMMSAVVRQAAGGRLVHRDLWHPTSVLGDALQGMPALARVAGALIAKRGTSLPEKRVDESGAQWLTRLALQGCTPDQRKLLGQLVVRNSTAPFTLRSVEALYPGRSRSMLDGLVARELVQPWRGDATFHIPEPVAEATPPHHQTAGTHPVVWASRVLQDTAGLLDGRPRPGFVARQESERFTPDELVPYVDEFMTLLANERGSAEQRDHITDGLAALLAVLGDAHRLVALYRLRPTPPVRRALGSFAADLGLPHRALAMFDADSWVSPDAVPAGAAICLQSGRLDGALGVLEGLLREDARPDERQHMAWASTVLGAVRCDRGEMAQAEQALLRAAALHRAAGCRRGVGWTLLHSARVCLLTGREAEADRVLDEAEDHLLAVADTRGRNWVLTERVRVALRHGGTETPEALAREALRQHEAAEDIRGMGWTYLYLGLAHMEGGAFGRARDVLNTAETYFLRCGDDLGAAWTRHRVALLTLPTGEGSFRDALAALESAWELFQWIGCPVGTAWTELEMVARRPPTDLSSMPLLDTARERFRALGDPCGQAWARAVEAVLQNHVLEQGPRTAEALVVSLPDSLPAWGLIVEEVTEFWRGRGVVGGHVIPFHARDAVAVGHTGHAFLASPVPVTPRCHVRVTLFDDGPAEDTTARLLLRVLPEEGHPWAVAEGDRPWLTVTAVPLTHASVDPASALLMPSEQPGHGAEFGFTAHRTGTHRIRFTIALDRTGTVLQQVETELDILDHDQQGELSSPEAVTQRGR
ncbi:ATP-binding protein [Streptomyces olindensis]|uniref:ATP-binding protein n=1 Tax=Streptomyces olindensis TaxID=358823 RepID=UPI0033E9EE56